MKTNGARLLESLGIHFELQEYEVDPSNPQDLSALTVARKIGMPPEQVFKTLLTTSGPNSYYFAVIPGNAELDFKKLARAIAGVPSDRSSSMGWKLSGVPSNRSSLLGWKLQTPQKASVLRSTGIFRAGLGARPVLAATSLPCSAPET